ncbi:MAG: carotenoid oxygenase family protein [Rhodoferax sp.]|uniref:carotenoid oxygenase family protein n=1 Tax=Rhodoferax sp. TaxID=50421 RepID=UPI002ACECA35|nr:carotenoid oxygenase family protein [Rhodoferax sp.]MDZ7892797.1 carotenoid oxygenase family protein [Rhodoferax sp.]
MWSNRNPFLQGPFEPLRNAYVIADLHVEGQIPDELNGSLYRTGSNQHFRPNDVDHFHWFDGDGMVHAFHLQNGRASYCNRLVETDGLKVERAAGRALYNGISGHSDQPQGPLPEGAPTIKSVAGINVISLAGKVLTMHEVDPYYWDLDPLTLETRGKFDFGGDFETMLTAHPHMDHHTGEMLFYAHDNEAQTLDCFATDPQGKVLSRHRVALPFKPWIHDFAFTEHYYVFVFGPVRIQPYAPHLVPMGKSALSFEPGAHTHVLLVHRHTGEALWLDSDLYLTLGHFLNAHEVDGTVVIDASITRTLEPGFTGRVEDFYPFPLVDAPSPFSAPELHRMVVNLSSGTVQTTRIGDFNAEFGRPNERFMGRPCRYGYMTGIHQPGPQTRGFNCIVKHDYQTGVSSFQHLSTGYDSTPGEAIFVPKQGAATEDEGWLMVVWWDPVRNASELVIHDARDISGEPVARIQLDHHIPLGFHGNWIAA